MDIHNFEDYLDLRDQQESSHMTAAGDAEAASESTTVPTVSPQWPASVTLNNDVIDNNLPTNMGDYIFSLQDPHWANILGATNQNNLVCGMSGVSDVDFSHHISPHLLLSPDNQMMVDGKPTSSETSSEMSPLNGGNESGTANSSTGGTISPAELSQPPQEESTEGIVTRSMKRNVTKSGNEPKSTTKPSNAGPESKKRSRGKKLYCICRQPYNGDPMVQCEQCEEWFHCSCVKLDPEEAEDIDWVCSECEKKKVEEPSIESSPKVTIQESPTQKVYSTRQSKNHTSQATCLLPSCNNPTRADSYCSDVCASKATRQQASVKPSTINASSPSPAAAKAKSSPKSSPKQSPKASPQPREKKSINSSSSGSNSNDSASQSSSAETSRASSPTKQADTPPSTVEENPIRKNVIRNMSNTLKSIIENALEKDPTLFESSESTEPTPEPANDDHAKSSPDNVLKATALAEELAKSIEEAMYTKLADAVPGKPGRILCGERYKSKFRSLLYNLKDKANEIFQMRVVTGDLVPEELARMSSEDMANPELKSMSETLRKKSIKDSVLKLQNMPIIKKTHKGDIIMIPNKETNFSEEQQPPPPPSPLSVDIHDRKRDYNDITKSDDATNSRKSSMSATPSTPTTAKTDPLDNILARIGVHADGTSDTANNDRNKKRKVTLDVEQLLGDEDIQLEIGSDDEGVITTRRTVNEHGEEVYEPERKKSEEPKPPVIWRGRVNMPQVAEFEGSARQIGGRTLSEAEWMDVLSPTMWIEGRIPRDRVTDYVTQTQYSTSREIVLLVIEPEPRQPSTSADVAQANHQQAQSLLHYFESRKRYGVVGHNKTKIKDFYLLPLYKTQDIPDCLYVVRVDEIQRECDLFLGVLVISKSVYTAPSFV